MLRARALRIPEVQIFEPRVFADDRGSLIEAWNARAFSVAGLHENFVQDNLVHSQRGVVRGLHYQLAHPQGKLVRCTTGEVFDVAVDLRRSSSHYGTAVWQILSQENGLSMWVPPGFAHGYSVLSDAATVYYKCTQFYDPASERTLRWNDPALAIEWPLHEMGATLVNARDAVAPLLAESECYA